MYKEIDELIDAIGDDYLFKKYCEAENQLYDEETLALLSRHQILQEDYHRLKTYARNEDLAQLREALKLVNLEMSKHPKIIHYYQNYYALNTLLEQITKIVFADISDDISLERLTL